MENPLFPSHHLGYITHRHETHDIYTQCSSPLAWVWHSAPAVVVELDSVSCAEAAVAVLSASSLPDSSTQWTSPPSWVWHSWFLSQPDCKLIQLQVGQTYHFGRGCGARFGRLSGFSARGSCCRVGGRSALHGRRGHGSRRTC